MREVVLPHGRKRHGGAMDHAADCFVGTSEVCRCLNDLDRYLAAMVSRIDIRGSSSNSGFLFETSIVSTNYAVTFVCQARRQHRLMVFMTEPYAARFLLGRVLPDGSSRIISNGALIFFDYLWHEGLYQDFCRDLSESLSLYESRGQDGRSLS